jgi:hypothetical protein
MAGRAKIEKLTAVYDGDLQILHLSQSLKAFHQFCRNDVQLISLRLKPKSNVLSMKRNYTIQQVVHKIRRLLRATKPSANVA